MPPDFPKKPQPKKGFQRLWHAFLYSWAGLKTAFQNETAFRQEMVAAFFMIPLAFLLPASPPISLMMASSIILVMVIELINSAIEATVDRVSQDYHPLAKQAKDLGSAAVLVSLVLCFLIWIFGIWESFFA